MKFLKKANRGIIFLILLILSVSIYIVVCSVQRSGMMSDSENFINQFVDKENDWRVIPDEYKDDPEGYIKSIEEEVKPYFENDKAYDAYIENVIMVQYKDYVFIEGMDVNRISIELFSFDGEQATCEFTVDYNMKTSENAGQSDSSFLGNGFKMKLCQVNNEIKIVSHDIDAYDFIQ